jgi:hypothetical protein
MHIMKKVGWALTALVAMLVPSVSLAEGKVPFGGMVSGRFEAMFNWIATLIVPDSKLWWLWLITFPLTIIWMLWSSSKLKQFFNKAGVFLFYGLPALAILLFFYGLPVALFLKIFGGVTTIVGFAMAPSLSGLWNSFLAVLHLIPVLLVIWILKKIPGIEMVVVKVLSFGKDMALKVWRLRDGAKPHWGYQILGALFLAGIINSSLVTNLTTDVAIPGIIPGISALAGLVFLFVRKVFGMNMVDFVSVKTTGLTNDGKVPCDNWFPELKSDGKTPKLDFRGKPKYVRCKGRNDPKSKTCDECGGALGFINWDCFKCNKKDIPATRKRCPGCGFERPELENRAHTHSVPPQVKDAARKGSDKKTGKKGCPHCGTQNPPEFNFCKKCHKQIGKPSDSSATPKAETPKQAEPASTPKPDKPGSKPRLRMKIQDHKRHKF